MIGQLAGWDLVCTHGLLLAVPGLLIGILVVRQRRQR